MQNPKIHHDTNRDSDLLFTLCERVEITWNARRDAAIVDQLAAEHPSYAEALYEFFALLIQSERNLDGQDSTFAQHDARAKDWLESGGYDRVAEVVRRVGSLSSGTDSGASVSGQGGSPPELFPGGGPTEIHPVQMAPTGATDRQSEASTETFTPAADESAAGVTARTEDTGRSWPLSQAQRRRRTSRTFLGLLIDETGQPPDVIAAELGINANFLLGVDDLGDALPVRARDELASRAAERYDLPRQQAIKHLCVAEPLPLAASRRAAYPRPLTYREVVLRSAMPHADEQFWLSLAFPSPKSRE